MRDFLGKDCIFTIQWHLSFTTWSLGVQRHNVLGKCPMNRRQPGNKEWGLLVNLQVSVTKGSELLSQAVWSLLLRFYIGNWRTSQMFLFWASKCKSAETLQSVQQECYWGWVCSSLVEHLPSRCEALGSILSTTKKKRKVSVTYCNLETRYYS
jgi:hypothetical protein